MFRIRTLILIIFIEFLMFFTAGLIHPYAVLYLEFLGMFFGFFCILIFLICTVKSIVKFVWGLFKPEKKILNKIGEVVVCLVLFYMFMVIFASSHYISFAGLRLHYSFVEDYDTIRTWSQNVELPEGGFLYMNGVDIPEQAKPFHPENVELREEEVRKLRLSWNSGFMQVGWELVICPPDEVYEVEKGLLAKIQPGVYLHYEFYGN